MTAFEANEENNEHDSMIDRRVRDASRSVWLAANHTLVEMVPSKWLCTCIPTAGRIRDDGRRRREPAFKHQLRLLLPV